MSGFIPVTEETQRKNKITGSQGKKFVRNKLKVTAKLHTLDTNSKHICARVDRSYSYCQKVPPTWKSGKIRFSTYLVWTLKERGWFRNNFETHIIVRELEWYVLGDIRIWMVKWNDCKHAKRTCRPDIITFVHRNVFVSSSFKTARKGVY